jgi:hypothetical protein
MKNTGTRMLLSEKPKRAFKIDLRTDVKFVCRICKVVFFSDLRDAAAAWRKAYLAGWRVYYEVPRLGVIYHYCPNCRTKIPENGREKK